MVHTPMNVYRLLWALLLHVMHGGGRDAVGVAVNWNCDDGEDFVTGNVRDVNWGDGLLMVDAFTAKPEHTTAPAGGLTMPGRLW